MVIAKSPNRKGLFGEMVVAKSPNRRNVEIFIFSRSTGYLIEVHFVAVLFWRILYSERSCRRWES